MVAYREPTSAEWAAEEQRLLRLRGERVIAADAPPPRGSKTESRTHRASPRRSHSTAGTVQDGHAQADGSAARPAPLPKPGAARLSPDREQCLKECCSASPGLRPIPSPGAAWRSFDVPTARGALTADALGHPKTRCCPCPPLQTSRPSKVSLWPSSMHIRACSASLPPAPPAVNGFDCSPSPR